MNSHLRAFVTAQLAGHQRRTRYTDQLAAVALGEAPYAIESCSCGFEVTRPVLLNARDEQARLKAVALAVETQWRDHLIDTVTHAVADWLAAGATPYALEAAEVERPVQAILGV